MSKKIKYLRVLQNGEYYRNITVEATRLQVIGFALKKAFRVLVILAISAAAIYGTFKVGQFSYASNDINITVDNLPLKIAELKADVLNRLKDCESKGYKESDAPVVFDSNSQFSFGKLQFQIKTVQHYIKTLRGKDVTRKEAILIALDEKEATELASDILFTSKNGAIDWANCANKLGLASDLKVIKKLEN